MNYRIILYIQKIKDHISGKKKASDPKITTVDLSKEAMMKIT